VLVIDLDGVAVGAAGFGAAATRPIRVEAEGPPQVLSAVGDVLGEFGDEVQGIEELEVAGDVAEEVGMHESTISRVTSNKYVATARGVFELKYFFNSAIRRESEDDIASESVKQAIKRIVESEDPHRPYSDQRIVELLGQEKVMIARRTVAKYREMLRILSSSKRKKFF
jgi:RNA polymerase sigma-54 factor